MIAVIYKFRLKDGKEKEYQKNWRKLADYFVKNRGAIGSCLHKAENDLWIAYSRWPDQKTRKASWTDNKKILATLPEDIQQTMMTMKNCIKRRYPETCMNVQEDLLT
jgi:quinol monooxygenase YgiN